MPRRARHLSGRALGLAALLAVLVTGCSDEEAQGKDPDPAQVDGVEIPAIGACRVLTPEDVAEPSNATRTVDCEEEVHTAQTFAAGVLPERLADADRDDEELGAFAYRTCSTAFMEFMGADESLVMRSMLSWAWFRPSEQAWDEGARWYRCDVVGGGDQAKEFLTLPERTEGLLAGRPADRWMACVEGPTIEDAPRIPCSQEHDWRAVSAIKVGEPEDPYPGERMVEVTTRDYCSRWVGAWLEYPVSYDYAYTWFHEAEWEAGNRRSVCWARTER
ncbi:septum formation family protein [Nocardioides sp. zg-DK7169]|uniref:septum formation family protein n=1 Tax=Nocardioides sp. zg-DK7169 TaxID=2736600 RepID=UPI0020A68CB9|nr:septum formation family protein [Nocardioides sp. zg-DK7169]